MDKHTVHTVDELIEFLRDGGEITCATYDERRDIIDAIAELGVFDTAQSSENRIASFGELNTHKYIDYKVAMDAICSQEIASSCMTEGDFEAMVAEMLSIKL